MFLENEKEMMFFEKETINKEILRRVIHKTLKKDIYLMEILFNCYEKKGSLFELLTTTLENIFISLEQKEDFFNVFSVLKKCINAFSRFKYLIKYKRARTYNTMDLFGDTFTKNSIVIFENNTKYNLMLCIIWF